jgi:hypothetical protein
MRWDSLRAITRRALWIEYRSPMICIQQEINSGSGSIDNSLLAIEPTFRLAGPTLAGAHVGADVNLTWTSVPTAFAYVVYRATAAAGPYEIRVAGLLDLHFSEAPTPGHTYFYKVTGIEPNFGETEASNIISFTI